VLGGDRRDVPSGHAGPAEQHTALLLLPRELAEHYNFLIAPCRPRALEQEGKVERGGVHYVTRNPLAGRAFRDIHQGNAHALH
jgi:hypothetical protein